MRYADETKIIFSMSKNLNMQWAADRDVDQTSAALLHPIVGVTQRFYYSMFEITLVHFIIT